MTSYRFRIALVAVLAAMLLGTVTGCSRASKSSGAGLDSAQRTASGETSSATASDTAAVKATAPTSSSGSAKGAGQTSGSGNAGTGATGSGSGTSTGTVPAKPGTATPKPGMKVLILFWNDTNSKPLKGTEIVIGSSTYKPKTAGKTDKGTLAAVPYGQIVQITVYPDGRSGKKLQVPLTVTKAMIPNSEQDAIHVAISDGSVRVLGNAISNLDQVLPRF